MDKREGSSIGSEHPTHNRTCVGSCPTPPTIYPSNDPRYFSKRRHFEANRHKYLERTRSRRNKIKAKINCFLKGNPCNKCGFSDIRALEFHHVDVNTKEITISRAIKNWGWPRISKEMEKCIVLCANCHRLEHLNLGTVKTGGGRNSKRSAELRLWFRTEILPNYACQNCNISDGRLLDFHHRDSSTKLFQVSSALGKNRNKSLILKEVDKCDTLCANCHLILHSEEHDI